MPKGKAKAGKIWASSPGLAVALTEAQGICGPVACVRETRNGNSKLCEVGHADMTATVPPWFRPMIVLGAGSTWFAAFDAAKQALEDPTIRDSVERHDEILAAHAATARTRAMTEAGAPPAEDA